MPCRRVRGIMHAAPSAARGCGEARPGGRPQGCRPRRSSRSSQAREERHLPARQQSGHISGSRRRPREPAPGRRRMAATRNRRICACENDGVVWGPRRTTDGVGVRDHRGSPAAHSRPASTCDRPGRRNPIHSPVGEKKGLRAPRVPASGPCLEILRAASDRASCQCRSATRTPPCVRPGRWPTVGPYARMGSSPGGGRQCESERWRGRRRPVANRATVPKPAAKATAARPSASAAHANRSRRRPPELEALRHRCSLAVPAPRRGAGVHRRCLAAGLGDGRP